METVWTDMMNFWERELEEESRGKKREERSSPTEGEKERRGWRHVLIIPLYW
jgi:hypothetical protein